MLAETESTASAETTTERNATAVKRPSVTMNPGEDVKEKLGRLAKYEQRTLSAQTLHLFKIFVLPHLDKLLAQHEQPAPQRAESFPYSPL